MCFKPERVKFQSNQTIPNPNVTSPKLCMILWSDFLMHIETGPCRFYITECLVHVDSQHRASHSHAEVMALKTLFVSKCDFHNEVQSYQSSMLEDMLFICAIDGDGICPIKCLRWYLPHVKCIYLWLMHWRYLSLALSHQYGLGKPLIVSYWFVLNSQQLRWWAKSYFTKGWWAHYWNLVKILSAVIIIIIILSGHKFPHFMAAELSWHGQNCHRITSLL